MMRTWFNDESANLLHKMLASELKPIIAKLCPMHELSNLGINRNHDTEEVIIKLHLNQIGRITVRADGEQTSDALPQITQSPSQEDKGKDGVR